MDCPELPEYVREMNNEIFLSQHQLNGLYIMLLLHKSSQWDHILPADDLKSKMAVVIDQKLEYVDSNLNLLLQAYEKKIKSNQITKIQRFMGILRAKQKSMYIHVRKPPHHYLQGFKQKQIGISKQMGLDQQKQDNDYQLLSVFHGISDMSHLSCLGVGIYMAYSDNIVQYNSSQRYITFKMGNKYNLTIKNDDPLSKDTVSQLRQIPKQIFIHKILPYFRASELFKLRAVCKQWEGYVKDAWHGCFRREMYSQLLASQLCRDIQFFYKLLQLRNPFYQKLVLLLHALIELISWDSLTQSIQNDTISMPMKRILLVLLMLLGHKLPIANLNSITETVWLNYKQQTLGLKEKITGYFSNLTNTVLSINQIKAIKTNFLDNPFIRIEEINGEDKTPLLLFIFMKQFTFQSIIKNHIILAQQYLGFAKNKLDQLYKGWPSNQKFLETAYKIILLKGRQTQNIQVSKGEQRSNHPDLQALLRAVLDSSIEEFQIPDFTIKTQSTLTNVYLDKRTKWDIILSTMRKTEEREQQNDQKLSEQSKLTQQSYRHEQNAQQLGKRQTQAQLTGEQLFVDKKVSQEAPRQQGVLEQSSNLMEHSKDFDTEKTGPQN